MKRSLATAALAALLLAPSAAFADEPVDPPVDAPVEQSIDEPVAAPTDEPTDEPVIEPVIDPDVPVIDPDVPVDPAPAIAAPLAAAPAVSAAATSPTTLITTCVFQGSSLPGAALGTLVDADGNSAGDASRVFSSLPTMIYDVSNSQTTVLLDAATNPGPPEVVCRSLTTAPAVPLSQTLGSTLYGCLYATGATIDNLGPLQEGVFLQLRNLLGDGFTGVVPSLLDIEDLGPVLLLGYQRFRNDGFSFDLCPTGDGRNVQAFGPADEPTPPVVTPPATTPAATPVAIAKPVATRTGVLPDTGGTDASLLILGGLLIVAGGATLGLRRRIA